MDCTLLSSYEHQVFIKGEWFVQCMPKHAYKWQFTKWRWRVGWGNHITVYCIYTLSSWLCITLGMSVGNMRHALAHSTTYTYIPNHPPDTHACTHTHITLTDTHNHWRSANVLLVVVCVCDDGVYKYICFTQVWSGDPLLTSEWYIQPWYP